MELTSYLATARRWWLLIAASVVLAAAGGYTVASRLPRTYDAEVRVLVGPLYADIETQRAAGQLTHTYAQLVTSYRVSDAVIRRLGLTIVPVDLQNATIAVPNDLTRLVTIRVQNGDPRLAAMLANAIAGELARLGSASGLPESRTEVVDPATVPTSPVAPQVSLLVLLAAFAGLLIAISGIVLIEYFRDSLSSEDELRKLSAAPILGKLPVRVGRRRDFASALLSSNAGDLYRSMTARIEQSLEDRALRTLLIAGVNYDAKAGVVATGLALGFADRGISTALVDANAKRPDATLALGLSPVAELDRTIAAGHLPTSRLYFVASTNRSIQPTHVELTVVRSGAERDLGNAKHIEMMIEELLASADAVVVTSPPLDRSPEALLWAHLVDAIVVIVPHPGTRRADVSSTVEALRLTGAKLAGTILTEAAALDRFGLRWRRPGGGQLSYRPAAVEELAADEDAAPLSAAGERRPLWPYRRG